MPDVLAPLLDLPGVAGSAAAARDAVDQLLGHRVLRRDSATVSAESALRGARASAALEGADVPLDAVREGLADPTVQAALRVSSEVGRLAPTWRRAPAQVLARLHVLAASGSVPAEHLGRPSGDLAVALRLDALAGLVAGGEGGGVPAVVVAAVVHGELLALAPFTGRNGLVARAAARLTMVSRGLDPKALGVPEVGHVELGYIEAVAAYSRGPDGLAEWIRHCCEAVELGAREGLAICEALRRR